MKPLGMAFLVVIAACCLLGLASLSWWTEALSWIICAGALVVLVYPLIYNKKPRGQRG